MNYLNPDIQIYTINTHEEILDELVKVTLSTSTTEFSERIKKINNPLIQRQSIAGRYLLAKSNGIDFNSIICDHTIGYTKWKKPFFKEGRTSFNISHSKNIVMLAQSNEALVGVDIQARIEVNNAIVKRILSQEEFSKVFRRNNNTESFFELWTSKESILKNYGCGLSGGIKNVKIFYDQKTLKPKWGIFKNQIYRLYAVSCPLGFTGMVAVR